MHCALLQTHRAQPRPPDLPHILETPFTLHLPRVAPLLAHKLGHSVGEHGRLAHRVVVRQGLGGGREADGLLHHVDDDGARAAGDEGDEPQRGEDVAVDLVEVGEAGERERGARSATRSREMGEVGMCEEWGQVGVDI